MKRAMDKATLSAYALGELGAQEAREVEAFLATDAAAKRFVEDVRVFSQFAERDLRSEPLPSGRGAEPVLRDIARRAADRAPARRQWVQALALGALIVLFALAFPLHERFEGQVARLFGRDPIGTVSEVTDEEKLSHRTPKEDPKVLDRDLSELRDRDRVDRRAGDCRFLFPAPGSADKLAAEPGGALAATYYLTASGLALDVHGRSAPQPLVHDVGVEEVARSGSFTLFRRVVSERKVIFFVVPEQATAPYCAVEVSTDWLVAEPIRKGLGSGLADLARSLADSIAIK